MIARLPIIPTIIVLAAAATMVALGIWQIGRSEEKALLIAQYSQATGNAEAAPFPLEGDGADVWFRRSDIVCDEVMAIQPVAGTAASGAKGWAMRAQCAVGGGRQALIDLGFSRGLELPQWDGGAVTGIIAPGPRLIADPVIGELQPLARPDPKDLPNNHIAYAGQWFFFAITALVIYGFAVKSRVSKRN